VFPGAALLSASIDVARFAADDGEGAQRGSWSGARLGITDEAPACHCAGKFERKQPCGCSALASRRYPDS
jgi:hypothetical protein